MTTLLLTLFFACGDKEEDSALTEPTSEPAEEVEDTAEEETEDTATEEAAEESRFMTNDQLGVCYPLDEVM